MNQLVAKAFLETMGHRVTLASNGEQALRAVEREAFDAVLMDISLPDMDGLEVTRRIRALPQADKRGVPIVAMSAHVFTSEIDAHLQAGMDAFIGKPMSPERLEDVLYQVLSGARGRPQPHAAAPEAAADDAAEIARQTLAEDLKVIGDARTGKLVELFLTTTPERVRQLSDAIAAGDCDAISFGAHSLKASASSLGLVRLANRLADIEEAAKSRERDALPGLHEGFEALYRDSSRLLTRTWDELSRQASATSPRG